MSLSREPWVKASVVVSGRDRLAAARLSVAGGKPLSGGSGRASLRLKSAAKTVVVAKVRVATGHGHTRSVSVHAKLIACP